MRLAYVDTEGVTPEGMSKFYKPITYGGKEAAEFLKDHLRFLHGREPAPESDRVSVDVEFDAVEDTIVGCRHYNQDNYGRVLAYLRGRQDARREPVAGHRSGQVLPVSTSSTAGRACTTPTFSRRKERPWPRIAASGDSPTPSRASSTPETTPATTPVCSLVVDARGNRPRFPRIGRRRRVAAVFVPRVHKDELIAAANDRRTITVFVDFQPKNPYVDLGIMRDVEHIAAGQTRVGTVIYAGTKAHPFNLWIDNARSSEAAKIKTLIERRYSRTGRNYAYVHGKSFHLPRRGIPQIQVDFADQITDAPNKDPLKLPPQRGGLPPGGCERESEEGRRVSR